MLNWFPHSPSTSDAQEPTVETSPRQPSVNRAEELRTPEQLPHDRILGNLFTHGQDKGVNATASSSLNSNTAVYDPFDGSFLGHTLAPDRNVQPEEEGDNEPVTVKNEELWSHLSRILDLQNHISRMHMDMEEIGMNTGDSRPKGKGRSRAASLSHVVIEDMVGDGGIGLTRDDEAVKNRAREEQFSKLANQFRGKKEAINGIMTQLDALSRAVTDFHTLQAPRIDFPSSPQNSVPDASPTRSREMPSVLVPVKAGTPGALTLVESPLSALPP